MFRFTSFSLFVLVSLVSPVLGVTVNSTQNVYGICLETETEPMKFKPYEDQGCGNSVDGLLIRHSVPFYLIWCNSQSWYGLTRVGGNYSTITSLGASPLGENGAEMDVIDASGTSQTIQSHCEHPPQDDEAGRTTTVIENSWKPLTDTSRFPPYCCILKFTPTHNYTNDIYLQYVRAHDRYVRLITDTSATPTTATPTTATPTTATPTTATPTDPNTNNTVSTNSSSSSSSSSSTGTTNINTAAGTNSSSSSTGVTSPSSTGKPAGSAATSTNPTVVAIVIIVCAAFWAQ